MFGFHGGLCFKKASLSLDLASTKEQACQVRCATELREDWERLAGKKTARLTVTLRKREDMQERQSIWW